MRTTFPGARKTGGFENTVITSYSIHYTKLYEAGDRSPSPDRGEGGGLEGELEGEVSHGRTPHVRRESHPGGARKEPCVV